MNRLKQVANTLQSPARPELVPTGYEKRCGLLHSEWAYEHLRWMIQKDSLGQDIFLLGSHSPLRRWLAFRFCEVLGRECEFLALTPDTSEVDLKSRRELRAVAGLQGALEVVWFDQAVVRAALGGRVLVLEGLEKAERNVLPVLNNLLENREMQLEDGRFLVAPQRYDRLVKEGKNAGQLNLVRVHEHFRVVALGVPSPPFPGNPLDPPLRSRFQARHIARAPADLLLQRLRSEAPKAPAEVLQQLLKFYETLWELMQVQGSTSGMEVRSMAFSAPCYPSEESVISAAKLLNQLPQLPLHAVIQRIFPFQMESGLLNGAMAKLVMTILPAEGTEENLEITGVVPEAKQQIRVQLRCGEALTEVRCQGGDGECSVDSRLPGFQMQLLSEMVSAASIGQDLCIIGPRGEGKTFLAQQLARGLGYSQIHTLFLHEEMTARDLFQRRTTNEKGESIWEPSPLLRAMEHGGLCVLDGLQQLRPMTLSALAPLIQDREVTLYDGDRFISTWRWQHLQGTAAMTEELRRRGTRVTHPSFRMVALATPPRAKGWLTNEVLQLFHFFVLPRNVDLQPVLSRSVPLCPHDLLQRLLQLRTRLLEASLDAGSPLWSGQNPLDTQGAIHPIVTLSLRSLLRAARVATGNTTQDVADYLQSALMMDFMPPNESAALQKILQSAGFILRPRSVRLREAAGMAIAAAAPGETLRIGAVQLEVLAPKESALIPETKFFDNPQQTLSLHDMLRDMAAQEHLLLMGNQGVGKNKLIDRLLMLLHREREYLQLHRDTTVGSLTLVPTLRNGLVSFDDSPLVKAMLHGRVLVTDEFDKAPTEVVLTLKGLLQDGEILLVDGRRFVKSVASMDASPIHPNFQVVALANRPGYPFLGNDFFREMGDCFACHAIQNPDEESEVAMLQSYAPDVPLELLHLLSSSFTELRGLVEAGKLSYPYSTRELVNLVRHLQQFPEDSLAEVMENVFAFDVYDPELRRLVLEVFQRHGLAMDPAAQAARPGPARQLVVDPPRICGQLRRAEGAQQPVTVKSCSLQRQWRRRWRGAQDQPGEAGAEWQPLEVHSARALRFSEEELWFRMGSVTKEGVLIRGHNPLTGSWLGNLLSMAAAENSLCILSSQMILDVYDLKTKQCRQLPLAVHGHRALHGATGNNTAMVALPGSGCLCAYDARQGSLLRIWPCSGEAEAFQLTLASPGAVKLQPWHGELLIYAEGGQELVVADMEGMAARVEVNLPGGLQSVDVLSDCRLMLSSSTGERLELTWPGNSTTGHMQDVKVVSSSVTLDVEPHFVSHPLPTSQLQLPDHLQSSMDGVWHSHVMSDGSSGRHGLLGLGFDQGASAPIWEYPRREALLGYLRSQLEAEEPEVVEVASVSCWHSASNSLVSVFSPVGDSPLRARFGMLYLEALNISSSMLRRVLLGKVPGLGCQSQAHPGPGTDSSLVDRGLLLTRRKVPDRVQHVEMPLCLAACELEDGRLALLFADSHVRILELRADSLALQEALHSSMLGRPGKESPEMVEENLEFDELEEGEDDLEDFEDDDQDDDSTNDGAGGLGGRSSGRRGKGGRGGRGRKGQGGRGSGGRGKGSGKSDGAKRARQEAEKVIKEARERAAEVRKIQKMKLELKDFDHAKYDELFKVVEKEIMQLRVILQSIEARERERTWLRGKVVGEFDDNKIVDLAIGEKNVFKRRGQREDHSFLQSMPKRLSFVVDVSGSMAVFNGDGRLDRLCATMVMMMESLVGLEHKYIYEIIGHSGESDWLPFVKMGEAPKDRVERYAVVEAMTDHAATARSGDNTLSAGVKAVQEIVKQEADDYFVFLVSDANLRGYGISPQDLAMALTGEARVNAHAIFIAEPEVAEEMTQCMPAGHAHLVMDTAGMPLLLKNIFARAVLAATGPSKL